MNRIDFELDTKDAGWHVPLKAPSVFLYKTIVDSRHLLWTGLNISLDHFFDNPRGLLFPMNIDAGPELAIIAVSCQTC